MKRVLRWSLLVIVVSALFVWTAVGFWYSSVLVDLAKVTRGPLEITVDEDGKTRIKDRYVISSPLTGRLVRVELEPGDQVLAHKTIAASIQPTAPSMLDARQKAQAEARKRAAELTVEHARSRQSQAQTLLDRAEKSYGRLSRLEKSVAQEDIEVAEAEFRSQKHAYAMADLATQIAQFELQQAEAALLHVNSDDDSSSTAEFVVRSPINGKVLRILQESSAVVQTGTALMELGDPANLEIEVDVLSSQAVRIAAGNRVIIEQWGGQLPLNGIVRRVDPAGFTKISALGVEEQRVNVIIDLVEPANLRASLGDAYRVEARIVVWSLDDGLLVPTSALFRAESDWAVFIVDNGKLKQQRIQLGQRNRQFAQVLGGLHEGNEVVLHPTDQLHEGIKVRK